MSNPVSFNEILFHKEHLNFNLNFDDKFTYCISDKELKQWEYNPSREQCVIVRTVLNNNCLMWNGTLLTITTSVIQIYHCVIVVEKLTNSILQILTISVWYFICIKSNVMAFELLGDCHKITHQFTTRYYKTSDLFL